MNAGVVIVNWNSSDDLLQCVDSIQELYADIHIVVVDNGSETDQVALLDQLDNSVRVISLEANRGYAAGVNAGLLALDREGMTWAWLMNPDARPDPLSLQTMLASSSGAVAISPRQYSSETRGHGVTYTSAANIQRGRVAAFTCEGCAVGSHDVDVVTGTGLLIRLADALVVGLLDEDFFHYKEEFEFVERISSRGSVRLVCQSAVWHRRGGSLAHQSPRAAYYRVRNELLYLRKRNKLWFVSPRFARTVVRSILSSCRRGQSSDQRNAVRVGVLDGTLGVGGPKASL